MCFQVFYNNTHHICQYRAICILCSVEFANQENILLYFGFSSKNTKKLGSLENAEQYNAKQIQTGIVTIVI